MKSTVSLESTTWTLVALGDSPTAQGPERKRPIGPRPDDQDHARVGRLQPG